MRPLPEAAKAISACFLIPGQPYRNGNLPQPVIPAVRGPCRHHPRAWGSAAFIAAGHRETKEFSRRVMLCADGGLAGPVADRRGRGWLGGQVRNTLSKIDCT